MISPVRAHPDQVFALALQHHQAGRLSEAEALYHQVLALEPRYADAFQLLGAILHQRGNSDLAVERIRQAIAIAPDNPVAHFNLGEIHRATGRSQEAIAEFHQAIQLKPDYFKACHNLGVALTGEGRLDEAIAAYRRAIEIDPANATIHYCLGNALQEGRRIDEAIASYHQALQLEATFGDALNNLAIALKDNGQMELALASYREALAIEPDQPMVHSNLIYAMHYHLDEEDGTIAAECARWNRRFSDPLRKTFRLHTNDRDPDRRLRIGYLSSDLRSHPVTYFLAPLLKAHDHLGFEIHCYSGSQQSDSVTEGLRRATNVWRDVSHLSAAQIAELIRVDGIDILVDLAMHTNGDLLLVAAGEPAPVQVSWLAYPGSTGVEAIQYRLTDATIDPITGDDGASQPGGKAVRLPDSWCCYEPLHVFPPVGPLPVIQNGFVTFGSVNQYAKITVPLVHCWARLLRAVAGSRLLLVCPSESAQQRTLAIFASHGLGSDRVEFTGRGGWEDYTRLFQRIDIALDTYPCNGMTTTCHTLWMGVPVVTRTGSTTVSRSASSLLFTVGLPEWVAHDEEGYVRIAIDAAHDLHRLADLRAGLRPRMQASPLMDAPRFARNVETAYRAMWRKWCRAIQTS